MLTELYLKNYILINELRLNFQEGMTVITGETGAGKSILVGALNLAFGKITSPHIAYDPAKDIYIELTFSIPETYTQVHQYLDEIGFPAENNEIVVAREIKTGGKSTSYLNGKKTAQAVLKELHDLLIDFHHQREQQNLLLSNYQLDILDLYAGLFPEREKFADLLQELKQTIKERDNLLAAEAANQQLIELYRFQADELNAANLKEGKDTELEQEFTLLSHAEEIISLAEQIYQNLYEREDSIYDSLSQACAQLQKYTEISGNVSDICNRLSICLENINDAGNGLRLIKEEISSDPARLEEIKSELDLINNLKVKYKKPSIAELLAYREQIEQAIASYESNNDTVQILSQKIEQLFSQCAEQADLLSEKRKIAADKLAQDILKNIKQLSIPHARLEIQIDKKTKDKILLSDLEKAYTESGQDRVEFLFSANPGSPLQPLKEIVSGGELSRILLAIKQVIAKVMPPKTIILDEIDSGIGGNTARAMAEFIHKLAAAFQVLCITHLAQIAAVADHHLMIEKQTRGENTAVKVELAEGSKRINEIARMLSGKITDLSVRHAQELINKG
ncbi:MAG TPA: DNA repair protein RecN [Candidatus Cloacimonadota bacterium]|nr:DNA repair protein RecN [Candidatus Cloacimonadota bacterium]HOV16502.1 DNA repair protein RecN [Candidatus Cloacimonadota bacterium]HQL15255.1 DNA repair protein RecN [Candidatus Cloacimonadota bacterium]